MSDQGECFVSAGKIVLDGFCWLESSLLEIDPDWAILCHGKVVGTDGPVKGEEYDHAWVELADGQVVLDPEAGWIGRAEDFYAQGQVHDVKRYTRDETRALLLQYEHWGPWPETGEA